MNFTETFDQFSSRLGPTDLALYAGAGLILWVLFKDKLSPVQKLLGNLLEKGKDLLTSKNKEYNQYSPAVVSKPISAIVTEITEQEKEDSFFKLVVSWKQTRDLAIKSGCTEAVRVADEMFPFLSPNVCQEKKEKSNE